MKIGNPAEKRNVAAADNSATPAKAAADAAKPQAGTVADPSAKVELSSSAASLMAGSSSADFDAEKVSRISQAIEDGSYKVNAEVIADKLIANAQEVLGKVQR
jgi:negative regulator of flagellin synthesis FlgM